MGLRPSPYWSVQFYYWGEEFARGDPSEPTNPMRYDRIRLNLPGTADYDPKWPKVMKWVDDPGDTAGDVVTFIDDVRMTGHSKENCHQVHRQFSSRVQWLGMQDAPRKFRPPSQTKAGAWTGTIFKIEPDTTSKSVSQEKWEKGKAIVERLDGLCRIAEEGRPLLNRKDLEKETGFLNHLAMTFDVIFPYLKGFYLTLNSWRSHRDEGDWKVSEKRWRKMLMLQLNLGKITEQEWEHWGEDKDEEINAPVQVRGSPSFQVDVSALASIFRASGGAGRVGSVPTGTYGHVRIRGRFWNRTRSHLHVWFRVQLQDWSVGIG